MAKMISVRDDVYDVIVQNAVGDEKPSDTLSRLLGIRNTHTRMSELEVGEWLDVHQNGYDHGKALKFMRLCPERVFTVTYEGDMLRFTRIK